jgi:glycerol uptake facilitator protein
VLIQTLAVISGAPFNPAVTVAMVALRQIKPTDAVIYIVAQLAGGLAGAGLTKLILVDEGASENYGAPAVSNALEGEISGGMAVEALGTFFLVWAIIGVAVNPQAAKDWAAFAIGGALGMAAMVLGPLTGGAFDPARSLGPAVWGSAFHRADTFVLVYLTGPLLGALAAAVLYSQVFLAPGKKDAGGAAPVG